MAIALAQTPVAAVNGSNGTSQGITWGSNTTNGNMIVVGVAYSQNASVAISDSQGNTYIPLLLNQLITGSGINDTLSVFYTKNIVGGTTPTVTATVGSIGIIAVAGAEYSGLSTLAPFDKQAVHTNASAANPTSTATQITADVNEVVVGFTMLSSVATLSAGSGFGHLTAANRSGLQIGFEDQIVSAFGAQTATFTDAASSAYACGVFTFGDIAVRSSYTLNNYQFANAGDGMSVTEKIR